MATTVAAAGGLALGVVSPALASSTTTQPVVAGTLAFVSAPGSPALGSVTLNGTDKTSTAPLAMDIGDNTGSGAGWNVTATSTQFTTSGTAPTTLPSGATTVQAAPTDACDAGVTCTLATNAITYPYALPAASTAPTATKLTDATAATGLADQTVTPTFAVAIPANTYAGSYTSTWTLSLVSAP